MLVLLLSVERMEHDSLKVWTTGSWNGERKTKWVFCIFELYRENLLGMFERETANVWNREYRCFKRETIKV